MAGTTTTEYTADGFEINTHYSEGSHIYQVDDRQRPVPRSIRHAFTRMDRYRLVATTQHNGSVTEYCVISSTTGVHFDESDFIAQFRNGTAVLLSGADVKLASSHRFVGQSCRDSKYIDFWTKNALGVLYCFGVTTDALFGEAESSSSESEVSICDDGDESSAKRSTIMTPKERISSISTPPTTRS